VHIRGGLTHSLRLPVSDLFWLNGLVREFWAVEGVEDGLLVGGDGGGVGLGGAVDREGR